MLVNKTLFTSFFKFQSTRFWIFPYRAVYKQLRYLINHELSQIGGPTNNEYCCSLPLLPTFITFFSFELICCLRIANIFVIII